MSRLRSQTPTSSHDYHQEGFLIKRGGFFKTWKKRYFIVHHRFKTLFYFEDKSEAHAALERSTSDQVYAIAKGGIPLQDALIIDVPSTEFDKAFCFSITPTSQSTSALNLFDTEPRTYFLVADNDSEKEAWMKYLILIAEDRLEEYARKQKLKKKKRHSKKSVNSSQHDINNKNSDNNSNNSSNNNNSNNQKHSDHHVATENRPSLTQLMRAALNDEEKFQSFKKKSVAYHLGKLTPLQYFVEYMTYFGASNAFKLFEVWVSAIPEKVKEQPIRKLLGGFVKVYFGNKMLNDLGQLSGAEAACKHLHKTIKNMVQTKGLEYVEQKYQQTLVTISLKKSKINNNNDSPTKRHSVPLTTNINGNTKSSSSSSSSLPHSESDADLLKRRQNERVARMAALKQEEEKKVETRMRAHSEATVTIRTWVHKHHSNIISMMNDLKSIAPVSISNELCITSLSDDSEMQQVKKCYQKCLLRIHPDKVINISEEDRLICSILFSVLRKAFERYQIKHSN